MLGTAIAIAATVHENQRDKGGHAYILHPIRIMMRLRTEDEELMSIAVLHDAIEDSANLPEDKRLTLDALRDRGFSDRVLKALALLTHDPAVPYMDYIRGIGTNRDASIVKLEDLKDNSDLSRLKGLRQKDFERHEKYIRASAYLRAVMKVDSEITGF